jgi:hypothetical protein
VRVACAALAAVLLTAARALDADPLLLDEFDPLALAGLCFAVLAGWPRGAPDSPGTAPSQSALCAFGAWTLVALAATAPSARLLLDGGRPASQLFTAVLALALVPACAEAVAVRASADERAARAHAYAWCVLVALPLLVHHGLRFAASRAADVEASGVRAAFAWLADAAPLGVALAALDATVSLRGLAPALLVLLALHAVAALARRRPSDGGAA